MSVVHISTLNRPYFTVLLTPHGSVLGVTLMPHASCLMPHAAYAALFLQVMNIDLIGRSCYLIGRSCYLIGRSCYLIGRSCYLIGRSCYSIGRSCYSIGRSCYSIGRSCYLIGRSCYLSPSFDRIVANFQGKEIGQKRAWTRIRPQNNGCSIWRTLIRCLRGGGGGV